MSNKKRNVKNTDSSTESKKAAVLGTGRKSKAPLIITLVVAAVAAGAGIYVMKDTEAGPVQAQAASSAPSDVEEFSYPVSDFDDGKAKYFSYKSPRGLNIRYFIIKSSDGVIRAAFDSCDTCWAAGKGYRQEGDYMVCNNCGLKFASVRINEVKGGCNPAPLTRKVQGDMVVIEVDDLVKEGSFYFDYGRRG